MIGFHAFDGRPQNCSNLTGVSVGFHPLEIARRNRLADFCRTSGIANRPQEPGVANSRRALGKLNLGVAYDFGASPFAQRLSGASDRIQQLV